MQAILTQYLPATNTKPSRIKAECERGSVIVSYPHDLSGADCHVFAADVLVQRFQREDKDRYGTQPVRNPWSAKRIVGGLPNGSMCHVFTK